MASRHPTVRSALTFVLGAGLIAACGAGPVAPSAAVLESGAAAVAAEPTAAPTIAPASGIVLELTGQQPEGQDLGWDVSTLTAPAGKTFEVAYTNDDDARHDFAVLPEAGSLSDIVFKSEMVPALESATITVPALPAGTYAFVCSLHASTMRGTLTIQ
jgi:plastocyanin